MAKKESIIVSAPGKIHFLGEHVVVHGKPALLTAIDKRCKVSITLRADTKIEIISKNFDTSLVTSTKEIIAKAEGARKLWEQFVQQNDVSFLSKITAEPLDYPLIAIGETIIFHNITVMPSGFSLEIDSEIPVGAGLGSSAALAVTIAAAVSLFLGKKLTQSELSDLAFRIEQRKHGFPSGGDPATVLHGGFVWFRKEVPELRIIQPVPFILPMKIAKNFLLIDTGRPNESTGEMVTFVKNLMKRRPAFTKRIFDDQEQLTRDLLSAIEERNEAKITKIIKAGEKNLEKLGVVSPSVRKLIRMVEQVGGAAKIIGGGGKTKGTGMVLCYHPNRKRLESMLQSRALPLYSIVLGVEGLRTDS